MAEYFRRKYAQFIRKVFLWSLEKMENYKPFKDSSFTMGNFVGLYHRILACDHNVITPQKKGDLIIIIDTKFIDYYKGKDE